MTVEYGGLTVHSLNTGDAQPIEWLWKGRMVRGGLNLIVGDEGVGKSTFIAWLLARITRGKLNGYLKESPSRVAVIGNEDSWEKAWIPRLYCAGVVQQRIFVIKKENLGQVNVTDDLNNLAKLLRRKKISVVYFDQLIDNFGDGDTYKTADVRKVLTPLNKMAMEYDISLIATLHPNKQRAETFRQKVPGPFLQVPRAALYLGHHPEDEHSRVLVVAKSNYGVRGKGLEFRIVPETIRPNGRGIETTKAIDVEPCEMTFEELIGNHKLKASPVVDKVARKVHSILADRKGHLASDILQDLMDEGHSQRSVYRAIKSLGVESIRDGFQGSVTWKLPVTTKGGSNKHSGSIDKKSS